MPKRITAPLDFETAQSLRSGDSVLLSGTIYTARDAAHKRLCELAAENKPMPFPMEGAVIYYAGPTPARPGQPIGSAGPTTSYRMDAYAPTLLRLGELGMIGKGSRGPEVIDAMKETGAVYFGAIGGAGASFPRFPANKHLSSILPLRRTASFNPKTLFRIFPHRHPLLSCTTI